MFQENCYVVSDDTKECVIIDCGAYTSEERQMIVDYVRTENLVPKHLMSTHGHLDHNFGNDTIYKEFGLRPEIGSKDNELLDKLNEQSEALIGQTLSYEPMPASRLLNDGDKIEFGNHSFEVLETPGHSQGSVLFICREEDVAFAGDTLFCGSIGRTDLPGGSMFQIIQSLRTISQLPDSMRILPGHGAETTIGEELRTNPYLDR